MGTALVICIGNRSRGDDGVAHRVAELLGEQPEAVAARIVTAPDLDIAMAADVAEASLLVVVDAQRRESPPVRSSPLTPGPSRRPTGHAVDAPGLLAVAETLYGRAPKATLVSVAAPEMGHCDTLSATAEAAALEAAAEVVRLVWT